MEVVDVISASLVAQTTRRRKDPQEEVRGLRSSRGVSGLTCSWRVQFGRMHFHPKSISSTDTFIQTRFHPKHFHPILTLSSNDTFIQ